MRPEKTLIVSEIQQRVNASPFLIVVNYGGMKVSQLTELRQRLYAVKAECRVVKNTLLKKALEKEGLPQLEESLTGQSAVVIGEKDVVAACKTIKNFVSEFSKPEIKLGILDKAVLSKAQILELADLPPREVLQAKLLGLISSPATKLVQLLNTPGGQLARVIKAKGEKA